MPGILMPVHNNLLWPSRAEALNAPRGEICLGFCENCNHVFNTRFDPARMNYSQQYENTLETSPRFQEYAASLAHRLVVQYNLHGKDLLEIGCGQGDFLSRLCELGPNRGIGFDPAAPSQPVSQVRLIQDYYSKKYAHYPVDFILSRQTLEHIQEPVIFLDMLRDAIGDRAGTILFFEVPNAAFILGALSVWDIIYEHPSYFSRRSLAALFLRCGFQVLSVEETFEGQFLTIEASLPEPPPGVGQEELLTPAKELLSQVADLSPEVDAFVHNFEQKVKIWQRHLDEVHALGKKAVVWGAGSKGVSFLNLLERGNGIRYAVDINSRKHGKFIAGTGQEIVSPEFLRDYKPDLVIVMNAIYEGEIRSQLGSLGIQAHILLA